MSMNFSLALDDLDISLIRKMNMRKNADTIDLGLGQLSLDTPRAMRDGGADSFTNDALNYSPTAGLPELKSIIAKHYNSSVNIDYKPEQVVVTSGAEHGLYCIFQAMLNHKDEVMIPELSYPAYPGIAKLFNANSIEYKLTRNFNIDIDDLISKITSKTKIILVNSPSNPTGTIICETDLKLLAERLKNINSDILLVSDEVYSELNDSSLAVSSINKFYENTVVISSLSKSASAAGLRLGWLIGPDELIKEVTKIVQYSITSVAVPSQKAALAYFNSNSNTSKVNKKLASNRRIITASFKNTPLETTTPLGAFYYFADISSYGNSRQVADRLLDKQNVLVIPGLAFGNAGDKYIRVSYGTETKVLEAGLKRIIEELL
ncbi:pyridoxal phosphate-dependent aminotransferase [Candidatus Saccharibacteria bacterium]|jgi:aspartate/methionine/tyrosine aminotransferase|nr:pyridoxal phosphate-dependent aminotransferase [Candidatus Saccharibacteria bacterium]MBP9132146.1 pyridoxal phosphate-dependent aminotransferase [Candidatus Saccharibacteria bacterium]